MRRLCIAVMMLLLSACESAPEDGNVTTARLDEAASEQENWLTYGGTYEEQRYSGLAAISKESVGELGLEWAHEFDTARGLEATPLVADGVIYTTSAWSKVHALNAVTGQLLWSYDPEVPGETGFKACCDVVNRGAAIYGDKVYVGTLDGRLIALNAKTGELLWSVVTVDQSKPYTITGAPRVIKGQVVIGNGGAEYGVRGYVTAYDAETGSKIWRFYTVPPAKGAKPDGAASDDIIAKMQATWDGDYSKFGGGGTVWDAIVYDQEFNQILIGVGNGSPWDHRTRSNGKGDNIFLSSVVALDADSGKYKWHYQGTPGESWDFTQTQPIILASLNIDGAERKVMMQAPKNGFFYVIDRSNGKLISAKNFVEQNWTSGVDMKTGRPMEKAGSRYEKGPFVALPSGHGAHNWQPMAFSPKTKLVYIPAQEVPMAYQSDAPFVGREGGWNLGVNLAINTLPDDKAELKAVRALLKGYLIAWDPIQQKEMWRVDHGGPWNGGVLATGGGLVFQGNAKGEFNAFDATNGNKLWSFDSKIGIIAPPISYSVRGKQYIALMVGYGGGYGVASPFTENMGPRPNGRLLVFALGGKEPYSVKRMDPGPAVVPKDSWSSEVVAKGAQIYENTCSVCHGGTARSSGVLPDLRRSPVLADQKVWQSVVHDGLLKENGMVGFSKWLSPEEVEAVRGYVAGRAKVLADKGI
jgi:quinohemoprotein ethanol dehydrogenase